MAKLKEFETHDFEPYPNFNSGSLTYYKCIRCNMVVYTVSPLQEAFISAHMHGKEYAMYLRRPEDSSCTEWEAQEAIQGIIR